MTHRVFQPVILFHDHSTINGGIIHIPYDYTPLIEQKKNQVGLMLKTNGKVWYDIIKSSRQIKQVEDEEEEEEEESISSFSSSYEEDSLISNISKKKNNGRKRRGNLPKSVTAVLKDWLIVHCKNPYPTELEKIELKDKTNLTLNQISNWFINARRRLLPQILLDQNETNNKRKRKEDIPAVINKRSKKKIKSEI